MALCEKVSVAVAFALGSHEADIVIDVINIISRNQGNTERSQ